MQNPPPQLWQINTRKDTQGNEGCILTSLKCLGRGPMPRMMIGAWPRDADDDHCPPFPLPSPLCSRLFSERALLLSVTPRTSTLTWCVFNIISSTMEARSVCLLFYYLLYYRLAKRIARKMVPWFFLIWCVYKWFSKPSHSSGFFWHTALVERIFSLHPTTSFFLSLFQY